MEVAHALRDLGAEPDLRRLVHALFPDVHLGCLFETLRLEVNGGFFLNDYLPQNLSILLANVHKLSQMCLKF